MNDTLIIIGLFIDFCGAFLILYDEYVRGKITSVRPDLTESLEQIGGRRRQRNRKNGLIALMVGFIVQVIGTVLPPF